MVGMAHKFLRRYFFKFFFDGKGCLSFGQSCAVADAEKVRVDGDRGFSKGNVEDHVGCLASDTRQLLERFSVARHRAGVFVDKHLTEFDDIPGFCIIEADSLDMVFDLSLAEFDHFFRRIRDFKQGFCRLVDPYIGGLCGQNNSNQ